MNAGRNRRAIGILFSGGLDSAVLVAHLLAKGHRVHPFYIRSGLVWERAELAAAQQFLCALRGPRLNDLVVLDLPLSDVYGTHWSVTGTAPPGADTSDEAVYLPGRNLLLIVKAALWCQRHGVEALALGVLRSNPFEDATEGFFADLQSLLNRSPDGPIRITRPLCELSKTHVLGLGRELPLELTFSCLAPVEGRHCGQCNKCAERQAAFQAAGIEDRTVYSLPAIAHR